MVAKLHVRKAATQVENVRAKKAALKVQGGGSRKNSKRHLPKPV
jgi:hypothetical protein